jgi:uncharacterized protein (TIGR03435 family)
MKHDDENAMNIEARLYDGLQLPAQEIVEADCERVLNRLKREGSFGVVRSNVPSARRWQRLAVLSAVAAVILAAVIGVTWQQRREVATLADGRVYKSGETFRSDGEQGTVMRLSDGSRVEMQSGSEASVEPAADGLRIRLKSGSIIVNAAKQAAGRHLYVETKDVTVSVIGTVFLVKADEKGSRVAVIKGEVRVQQGNVERILRPGEQVASDSSLDDLAMFRETGWSREAAAYLSTLHEILAKRLTARQSADRAGAVTDKSHFEEAAIRRCDADFQAPQGARGGGSNSFRLSPGRLEALCMTAATLIRTASRGFQNNPVVPDLFDVQPWRWNQTQSLRPEDGTRVRGGPDWVRSDKYAITAVAQGAVDAETLAGPMLMELLKQRFNLKMQVESEEVPVWTLGIAKGGLKIKPTEPGSCFAMKSPPLSEDDGRRLNEERGTKPVCWFTEERIGSNRKLTVTGFTMSELATLLSSASWRIADRVGPLSSTLDGLLVLDKTGIPPATRFDYVLEYAIDAVSVRDQAADPGGPSIFTALEKLGLRLEKSKGLREFLMIEHIDRPSDN